MTNLRTIKSTLFVCVLLGGLLSSCKKDEDVKTPDNGVKETCKLISTEIDTWMGKMTATLTYNDKSQLIENKSASPMGISGSTFTYDLDGRLSMKEDYEGAGKEVYLRYVYTYSGGILAETKKYMPDGSGMGLIEVQRNEVHNGKITRTNLFEINGGQEEASGYLLYAYDAAGNTAKINGYQADGNGGFTETMRRTLSYDSKKATRSMITLMTDDPHFSAVNNILRDKTELYDIHKKTWEVDEDNVYEITYDNRNLPVSVKTSIGVATLGYTCN